MTIVGIDLAAGGLTRREIRALAKMLGLSCGRCGAVSMLRMRGPIPTREAGRDYMRAARAWIEQKPGDAELIPDPESALVCPGCGARLRFEGPARPPLPIVRLMLVEEWEEHEAAQWARMPIELAAELAKPVRRWMLEHRREET